MESSPASTALPSSPSSSIITNNTNNNNNNNIDNTVTTFTSNSSNTRPGSFHSPPRHTTSGVNSALAAIVHTTSAAPQASSNYTSQRHNASHSRNISLTTCHHKALLRCNLGTQLCCACRDQRQHVAFYPRYVDGFGNVTDAPRWENYCSYCKLGWNTLMARANVRPDNSHIPEYPPLTSSALGLNISSQPNSPISSTHFSRSDTIQQRWHESGNDAMEIDSSSHSMDGFAPTFAIFHEIYPDYPTLFDMTTSSAIREWARLESRLNGVPHDNEDRANLTTEYRDMRATVKDLVRSANRTIGGLQNQQQSQTPRIDSGMRPHTGAPPLHPLYPIYHHNYALGPPRLDTNLSELRPLSRTITSESEIFSTASSRRREVTERFDREMENRQHQQPHPVLPPLPNPGSYHHWHPAPRPSDSNGDSSTATSTSDMDSTAANMGDDDRPSQAPVSSPPARRESSRYSQAAIRAIYQGRRQTDAALAAGVAPVLSGLSSSRIQRPRRTTSHNWNASGVDRLASESWAEPMLEPHWLRREPHSGEGGPSHVRPVTQSDGMAGGVLGTREDVQRDDYESPLYVMFSNEWDAYRQNQERTRQFAAREVEVRRELEIRNRLQEDIRIQQALEHQQREQMHQNLIRMQELQARSFAAEQALGLAAAAQTAAAHNTSTAAPTSVTTPAPPSASTSAATTPASNSRFHEGSRSSQTLNNHTWIEPADMMDSLSVSEMESLDETDGESTYSPEEREERAEREALREQHADITTFEQRANVYRTIQEDAQQRFRHPRVNNSSSNNPETPVSSSARENSRMERNRRIRLEAENLRRTHLGPHHDEAMRFAYHNFVGERMLRAGAPPTAIVTPIRNLDHSERPENLKDEDLKIMVDCKVCYGQVADMLLLPCAHLVLCQWCADTVAPLHIGHPERVAPRSICPVCRTKVDKKMKVFRC